MADPNLSVETDIDTCVVPYGAAAIAEAARVIAGGGCVAVPTETVYGLAADATNARAVAGIYAAKGRPSFNPLIVHVPDLAAAEALAVFDADARALAAAFWPGPLTLVLPVRADSGLASLVTAGLDTVAIRVPAHRAMRALLAACGVPLAAPSANASNAISPTRAAHVLATLNGRIPLVIDDGATEAGVESTIVATTGDVRILREGPITHEQLGLFPHEGGETATVPGKVTAPGQLASHYAPNKRLRLNATEAEQGEWLIGFGEIEGDATLSVIGDLTEAAANLFDALHRADTSDRETISVAPIPATGIGAAINDRLARAAYR
ncbi:translation factor Sua5 [Sphingomonas sp. Leaf357]|uniref:L-threonylcarbamoyladenylate synthase n=1 Tax=Sphingomonas sp. Leaf357 TaxID=1736350 RepID=UPI0006FFD457|nr:L-threonylcarbamoyladenylate synthase [Sphingomonas sp. Leaf357]KQS03310.1 translation factor Sua5 [Sphingomonas sp. Leaf357]